MHLFRAIYIELRYVLTRTFLLIRAHSLCEPLFSKEMFVKLSQGCLTFRSLKMNKIPAKMKPKTATNGDLGDTVTEFRTAFLQPKEGSNIANVINATTFIGRMDATNISSVQSQVSFEIARISSNLSMAEDNSVADGLNIPIIVMGAHDQTEKNCFSVFLYEAIEDAMIDRISIENVLLIHKEPIDFSQTHRYTQDKCLFTLNTQDKMELDKDFGIGVVTDKHTVADYQAQRIYLPHLSAEFRVFFRSPTLLPRPDWFNIMTSKTFLPPSYALCHKQYLNSISTTYVSIVSTCGTAVAFRELLKEAQKMGEAHWINVRLSCGFCVSAFLCVLLCVSDGVSVCV